MLQNVRGSLRIRGECLEDCCKRIVLIVSFKMVNFGTCLLVHEFVDLDLQVIRVVARKEFISFNSADFTVANVKVGESFMINSCKFNHN